MPLMPLIDLALCTRVLNLQVMVDAMLCCVLTATCWHLYRPDMRVPPKRWQVTNRRLCCSRTNLWGVVPSRRYLAWKHEQLLYIDVLGGIYTFGIALSLTKPALWQHPATWVLLMMTLVKALPHVPLLLGYKQEHIRYTRVGTGVCRSSRMYVRSAQCAND